MSTTQSIIELNKFINNNPYLLLEIDEVQIKNSIEPLFKIFMKKNSEKIELEIFSEKDAINFNTLIEFIAEIKLFNKDCIIHSIIKPLMPQYQSMLEDKLNESVLHFAEKISINALIQDIDESKLDKLTKKQQKELFNDICKYGNDGPIKKIMDFALSEKDRKNNINKEDIFFGLATAIEEGNLNIVKVILDHDKINNIIDFSQRSADLKNIIPYAMGRNKKDILSYIMNDKQYKLSEAEVNYYNSNDPDVKRFFRDYKNSLPKANKLRI